MRSTKPPTRDTSARTRRLSAKTRTLTRLTGCAASAMMGAAIGLAFATIATLSPLFGVTPTLATMTAPEFRLVDFAITSTIAFAIVAALTGLALDREGNE